MTGRDISKYEEIELDKKRQEEAISSMQIVATWNDEGKLLDANRNFYDAFKTSGRKAIGKHHDHFDCSPWLKPGDSPRK